MDEDLSTTIDNVVAKFLRVVNVLFSTNTFYVVSTQYALDTREKRLMDDYLELEHDLKELHKGVEGDFYTEVVKKHMRSMCFISLVSAFEEFLTDICMLALKKHPYKISGEQVDFKKVIEMERDEIIEFKAKEYLNKIMYMSPKDYLKAICSLLSVEPLTINDNFIKYIEIKARRDLGVHNDWKKNEIYLRKVKESGGRIPEDSLVLRPSHLYFKYSYRVCRSLVKEISKQSCDNLFKVDVYELPEIEIPVLD